MEIVVPNEIEGGQIVFVAGTCEELHDKLCGVRACLLEPCGLCGSTQVERTLFVKDNGDATRGLACNDCGARLYVNTGRSGFTYKNRSRPQQGFEGEWKNGWQKKEYRNDQYSQPAQTSYQPQDQAGAQPDTAGASAGSEAPAGGQNSIPF